MTSGHPGAPGLQSQRWLRERLVGMGLAAEQIVSTRLRASNAFTVHDLEPAAFHPEFAPLVQRVQRLLGGGRGLSVFATSARSEPVVRLEAALDLARGLAPAGRTVVLVDADFLRPGLGGLVSDTLAEGMTDMVRFGRSTRALLQHPLPEGAWILPAGSFPADDPAPLSLDAFRSVVYRVSQICELAIYVGPLPIRNELHPLARVCDHVVYAAPDDGPESGAACAEAVARLQTHGAHVLGVVVAAAPEPAYAPPIPAPASPEPPVFPSATSAPPAPVAAAPASPAPPEPAPTTAVPPRWAPVPPLIEPLESPPAHLPSEPALPAEPVPPPPALKRDGPFAPRPWELRPEPAPVAKPEPELEPTLEIEPEPAVADLWQKPSAAPGAPPAPWDLPPDVTLPPRFESPPARGWAEIEPEAFAPRPESRSERPSPPHFGLPELGETPARDAETSSSRPSRRARSESRQAPAGEFAFEEERKSRLPALAVIAMLVVIGAFLVAVGPRLYRTWFGDEDAGSVTTPATPPEATPNDEEAARAGTQPPATAPADSAAVPPAGSAAGTTRDTTVTASPAEPPTSAPTRPSAPRREPETPSQPPPSAPPATPAAPPASVPATATPGGAYAVHVASYKTEKQAGVEIASLAARGWPARAIQADLGSKGVWYRILVGPYATRAEADSARAALLAIPGYDFAQVRRVPRD